MALYPNFAPVVWQESRELHDPGRPSKIVREAEDCVGWDAVFGRRPRFHPYQGVGGPDLEVGAGE